MGNNLTPRQDRKHLSSNSNGRGAIKLNLRRSTTTCSFESPRILYTNHIYSVDTTASSRSCPVEDKMGGETDNLPTRRRTNSGLMGSSALLSPKKEEDTTYAKHTLMRCRYYYVGCHEMIESGKYVQHLEDYQREHLRQLEATVALQLQKIALLETQSANAVAAQFREEP